ncbi:MAG: T9SS type A sorting domain-containing protein, partial [Chitinivibrionales bacterium]|nr:T9SS type A sorting domain-containing protein [Chitinivibrionales bacterium]
PASLRIYDLQGKLVADPSEQLRGGLTTAIWRTRGLPAGTYVVRLVDGRGAVTRQITLRP